MPVIFGHFEKKIVKAFQQTLIDIDHWSIGAGEINMSEETWGLQITCM